AASARSLRSYCDSCQSCSPRPLEAVTPPPHSPPATRFRSCRYHATALRIRAETFSAPWSPISPTTCSPEFCVVVGLERVPETKRLVRLFEVDQARFHNLKTGKRSRQQAFDRLDAIGILRHRPQSPPF